MRRSKRFKSIYSSPRFNLEYIPLDILFEIFNYVGFYNMLRFEESSLYGQNMFRNWIQLNFLKVVSNNLYGSAYSNSFMYLKQYVWSQFGFSLKSMVDDKEFCIDVVWNDWNKVQKVMIGRKHVPNNISGNIRSYISQNHIRIDRVKCKPNTNKIRNNTQHKLLNRASDLMIGLLTHEGLNNIRIITSNGNHLRTLTKHDTQPLRIGDILCLLDLSSGEKKNLVDSADDVRLPFLVDYLPVDIVKTL